MDEHEATVRADEDPPVWGRAVDMIREKAVLRAERDALASEVDRLSADLCEAERWLDRFGVDPDTDDPAMHDLPSRILMVCEQEAHARQERDEAIQEAKAATAGRDALVAACIVEYRTNDSGVLEHVWEWQLAGMGDTEPTRERAVAALMRAAGLKAGGDADG